MAEQITAGSDGDAPTTTVRLEGGPDTFPEELRMAEVSPLEQTVKVPHRGGYEHFRRGADTGETVFHWTGRTRIAE
jgi:hypothetical protein